MHNTSNLHQKQGCHSKIIPPKHPEDLEDLSKSNNYPFFFQYKLPNVHTIYFNPTHESIQANKKIYIVGPRTETPFFLIFFFFWQKSKVLKESEKCIEPNLKCAQNTQS